MWLLNHSIVSVKIYGLMEKMSIHIKLPTFVPIHSQKSNLILYGMNSKINANSKRMNTLAVLKLKKRLFAIFQIIKILIISPSQNFNLFK